MELIVKVVQNEFERLDLKYKSKITELENTIKELKKEHQNELLNATHIRWDESGKYYNLKDFCRVSRDLLFIKETELKQWLNQQEILKIENDKYVPNDSSDICILIDNELYIKYSFIREELMTLRTLIFLGDNKIIDNIVKNYKDSKEVFIEQMANTVYVECKQRSEEFREHRDNKFFLDSKNTKEVEY